MWKKVRSLAKPVRWASFCDPLFLGSPARICLPRLLFLVYLWIAYFPLKSQTPALLHLCLKWHINLNCPMCLHVSFLWHPVMHICNKIWTFSPVSLSYVNLIISPARRKQKVGQKLVFLHPHRQVTPLLWEIIWGSLYLGLHGISHWLSHIKILKKKKKAETSWSHLFSQLFPTPSNTELCQERKQLSNLLSFLYKYIQPLAIVKKIHILFVCSIFIFLLILSIFSTIPDQLIFITVAKVACSSHCSRSLPEWYLTCIL